MRLLLLALAATLSWYGCGTRAGDEDVLGTRQVTLPNGLEIRAEVMIRPADMARGMMFRDSLDRGRGMLFIHDKPASYPYYMYNCRIPLDIVFMDSDRRIVEIAANVPPCKTKASECPTYGGHFPTQFVLELGAGEAARNGLGPGQTLSF